MNSKDFGDIGESQVLLAMIKKGYHVSIPFGDNRPYDLIVEGTDGKLYKVQCKYATLQDNGTIQVYLYSTTRRANKSEDETVFIKQYYSDIDFMAVYCPDIDKVFVIPATKFSGKTTMKLRVTETSNNQTSSINYAKDFSIDKLAI